MLQCLPILYFVSTIYIFIVKGRNLSKPSRLFMVHGDAHICILTYYFKNEMLGAQKNTCAREEYHLFRVLQQKRKLFCILHFFPYFMMVHSKSNDKLISSLAWNSFYYHLKTENTKSYKQHHWKFDNNGETFWNHWIGKLIW